MGSHSHDLTIDDYMKRCMVRSCAAKISMVWVGAYLYGKESIKQWFAYKLSSTAPQGLKASGIIPTSSESWSKDATPLSDPSDVNHPRAYGPHTETVFL